MGVLIPNADIPVDTRSILTVLLFKVLKSKNGGLSSALFLSLIFRFWFFKCRIALRCG